MSTENQIKQLGEVATLSGMILRIGVEGGKAVLEADGEREYLRPDAAEDLAQKLGMAVALARAPISETAMVNGRHTADVLAQLFTDHGTAKMVCMRAGIPSGQIPTMSTPTVFWSKVVDMALAGVTRGGLASIIDEALGYYPANARLRAERARWG